MLRARRPGGGSCPHQRAGVRQLGGLASELAKQTAEKAQEQQDVVLKDAQQLDLDSLYQQEPIGTWPPQDNAGDDSAS